MNFEFINDKEDEKKKINFCQLDRLEIENLLKGRKQKIKLIKTLKVYKDSAMLLGFAFRENIEPAVFFIKKMDNLEDKSLFQKQQRQKEYDDSKNNQDIFQLRDSFFITLPSTIDFFLQVNQYIVTLASNGKYDTELIEFLKKRIKNLEEKQNYIQNYSENISHKSNEKDLHEFLIYPDKLINVLKENDLDATKVFQEDSFKIMSSQNYYQMKEFTNRFIYKIFEKNQILEKDSYLSKQIQAQNFVHDVINSQFFQDNVLYLFIIDQNGFRVHESIQKLNIKLLQFVKVIFANINIFNSDLSTNNIALTQLSSLTHVEINLRSKVSNSQFESVKNKLSLMQNLQTLLLDISFNILNNDSVISTAQVLSELKHLRNLYFLINNTQVNKQGLCQIADLLSQLSELETLIIDVRQCRIDIEGPKALANCCKKLKMIKVFEAQFSTSFQRLVFEFELTLMELQYKISQAIQYQYLKIESQKGLEIRLQSNYLDTDEVETLFNYLSQIPNLNSLKLDLCSTLINDKGVSYLEKYLIQRKELKQLVLNLSYNKISNEGSFKFGQCLRKITNLYQLDFIYQDPLKKLFFELSYFYEDHFNPQQRALVSPKYLTINPLSKQIQIDLSDSQLMGINEQSIELMMSLLSQQNKIQGLVFSKLDRERLSDIYQIISQLYLLKNIKILKFQNFYGKLTVSEQILRQKINRKAFKMPRLVNFIMSK